jgi:hypothetical protein
MDPFRLIIVDGMFTITGRGFYVTPSLPVIGMTKAGYDVKPLALADTETRTIRDGDALELRRPDGTALHTILAVSHARSVSGGSSYPLRLPTSVPAADVPVGTEVWWIASGKE